jgi:hypothetical protein
MDFFEIFPHIVLTITSGVGLYFFLTWYRTRKYPPTDEPQVGEYRIEVDVGTHITPLEGMLYYFNKFLNPMHFQTLWEALKQEKLHTDLKKLERFLRKKGHFYAMRQGTRKVVIVSVYHPIETTPYFKTEQGSWKKIVHAPGWISDKVIGGFQHIVMEPLNLQKNELNPKEAKMFDKCGELLSAIYEQTPLLEQIEAEKKKNEVMQKKVGGMDDEIGRLTDELEYWKHLARKRTPEAEEERRLVIPSWIRFILPLAIAFGIGWMLSPSITFTAPYPPIFLASAFAFTLFLIRRWLKI